MNRTVLLLTGLILLYAQRLAWCDGVIPEGPRPYLDFSRIPEYELRGSVKTFDDRVVPLWLRALEHGDREVVSKVAESFLIAREIGQPGLDGTVGEALLRAYQKTDTDDGITRRSLARVFVAFNYRPAEQGLTESLTEQDYQLCTIVEPALADWGNKETIERNLQRLQNTQTQLPWRQLAIQVLGKSGDESVRGPLLEIVKNERERIDLRVLAAKSLGTALKNGLLQEAAEMASQDGAESRFAHLLAVTMISGHSGSDVLPVLDQLAGSPETTVQNLALAQMLSLSPERVAAYAFAQGPDNIFNVNHPHSGVRKTLIEAAFLVKKPDSIPVLAAFLDDHHPGNRQSAADALHAIATEVPDLKASVISAILDSLSSESWRVLEHAAYLAAAFQLTDTAPRMVELLRFNREEVGAAAGFALKEFRRPESLAPALAHIQSCMTRHYNLSYDQQLHDYTYVCKSAQHLCELIARMNYKEADATLRQFIPKAEESGQLIHSPDTRTVAIDCLGKLHTGDPEDQLVDALISRLKDVDSLMPEFSNVREACAYALGNMLASKAVPQLRRFAYRHDTFRSASGASAWALQHLTGEVTELPGPVQDLQTADWFLKPPPEKN